MYLFRRILFLTIWYYITGHCAVKQSKNFQATTVLTHTLRVASITTIGLGTLLQFLCGLFLSYHSFCLLPSFPVRV